MTALATTFTTDSTDSNQGKAARVQLAAWVDGLLCSSATESVDTVESVTLRGMIIMISHD